MKDIGHSRFLPFLTLHEFESLLFSSPAHIAEALPGGSSLKPRFLAIRDQFHTPEEINDRPTTAPHKRIETIHPGYKKASYGSAIASRIGLEAIRNECPHFSSWLIKLEGLSS